MKILLLLLLNALTASAQIIPHISTYLGDGQRNYYGNVAPSRLNVKWKTHLGSGKTELGRGAIRTWNGTGWTGQPLALQCGSDPHLLP